MQRIAKNPLLFTGVFAASLALPSLSFAHGGTYRGPQDTVPPSGGGGSQGGGVPTPGPVGPGVPGGGRQTPGAVTPGQPAGDPAGGRRNTGGDGAGADLTGWEYWWAFNRDPFLNLKSHIASLGVQTGSEEHYLGRGESVQSRDMLRVSEQKVRGDIVPRLLAALKSESSNDVQSSCMIALAKIGEAKGEDGKSPIAEAIRPLLIDKSQEVSETAAVALGILADKANIGLLTAVLENDDARMRSLGVGQIGDVSVRTRAFAAYGLGLIGYKASATDRVQILATLRKILDGEGKRMAQRDIQVACLTAVGLMPLAHSATDLEGIDGVNTTPNSMETLQEQLRYLLAYYADESNNHLIRAHAPTAMARLLSVSDSAAVANLREEVAGILSKSLTRESKDTNAIQQSCVLALGMIGDCDEDAVDKSIRAKLMGVKDELMDQQVRNFALIALAQASGRPGTGLGDPIDGVNTKNKRENSRSFLLAQLGQGKSAVYPWSGMALAVMERGLDDARLASSPEVKQALQSALEQAGSPSHQGAFAIACGLVRDPAAKDVLLRNLERVRDVEARGYTAVGLGLLGDRSALPAIQEVVRKSKYQAPLLKSAAIGLGLLGDKDLVEELVVMLKGATGLSSQAAISSALGFIGDSRSVDPLIEMMQDQEVTALARAFAAVALGIISDKEPLPWNSKIAVGSNYHANTETLTNQTSGILDIL